MNQPQSGEQLQLESRHAEASLVGLSPGCVFRERQGDVDKNKLTHRLLRRYITNNDNRYRTYGKSIFKKAAVTMVGV